MKYTKFGEFFRILRIKHNEVLQNAKDFLGVSVAYISAVELGKKPVPCDWYDKICKHYHLNEKEKKELREAIEDSVQNVKFDLKNASFEKRQLAVQFQRSFDDFDDDTIEKLLKILKKGND